MPQRIENRVLLTTMEAQQLSGLSREHIQWLLRQGRLEGFKGGHDWFVFEDSLSNFIATPRKPGPKSKQPLVESADLTMPDLHGNMGNK